MTALTTQIEAYAFRQLVEHLQWRTDVQNIDIMNLAGFCRNCLAKWYVAGAKTYGMPMNYEQACERIYSEPLPQWKKKYQRPASQDQMAAFEQGKAKHARTEPSLPVAVPPVGGGHSSVCGQRCDPEPPDAAGVAADLAAMGEQGGAPPPDGTATKARVAVLTVSDRAHAGTYADESGPAIEASLTTFAARSEGVFAATVVQRAVVPDDEASIAQKLQGWSELPCCNVIITTGGTGFGPRDVTPEATRSVLARPAEGLARAMAWQTAPAEPHSVLSRGVCGVTSTGVLVINVPGHPAAVRQCLAVVLPVLPHALRMLGA